VFYCIVKVGDELCIVSYKIFSNKSKIHLEINIKCNIIYKKRTFVWG